MAYTKRTAASKKGLKLLHQPRPGTVSPCVTLLLGHVVVLGVGSWQVVLPRCQGRSTWASSKKQSSPPPSFLPRTRRNQCDSLDAPEERCVIVRDTMDGIARLNRRLGILFTPSLTENTVYQRGGKRGAV